MGFITKSNLKLCLRVDRGSFKELWKTLEFNLVQYDNEVMLQAREAVMNQPGTLTESQGDGTYPQTGRNAQAVTATILAKHIESGRFLRVGHCILKRSSELDTTNPQIKGK